MLAGRVVFYSNCYLPVQMEDAMQTKLQVRTKFFLSVVTIMLFLGSWPIGNVLAQNTSSQEAAQPTQASGPTGISQFCGQVKFANPVPVPTCEGCTGYDVFVPTDGSPVAFWYLYGDFDLKKDHYYLVTGKREDRAEPWLSIEYGPITSSLYATDVQEVSSDKCSKPPTPPTLTPTPTSPPKETTSEKNIVIFVKGIKSTLESEEVGNLDNMRVFSDAVRAVLPKDTQLFYYSYLGNDLKTGIPYTYRCSDTFSQSLITDINLLNQQIYRIADSFPKGTKTNFYIIGHSLGGAIAFGYAAFLGQGKVYTSMPEGASLKAIITVDSPLGGVPTKLLNNGLISGSLLTYFGDCVTYLADEMLATVDLEKIYSPPNNPYIPKSRIQKSSGTIGATKSIIHIYNDYAQVFDMTNPLPTNQKLAKQAHDKLGTSFLTIGNKTDMLYNAQRCTFLADPSYTSTQWLKEDKKSGIRVFEYTTKHTCPVTLGKIIASHVDIINSGDVKDKITAFLKNIYQTKK
jgi:pimeloyl-ACP methyl ester carboxylesterase